MNADDMRVLPLCDIIAWLETKPKKWQIVATYLYSRLAAIRKRAGLNRDQFNNRAGVWSAFGCAHLESGNLWRMSLKETLKALRTYDTINNC